MTDVKASIVLATYNRKDDLALTIESSLAQTVPVEVIVMDDGSTDGTPEMVRERFPTVYLYQLGRNRGPNFQRTEGFRRARAPIVFPNDDDCVFSAPDIVETALEGFDHPRVGIVAIPYINVRSEDWVRHQAPSCDGLYIARACAGGAAAMRRDVFLGVGGYRADQFNGGEESDLAIRMLDAGYVIRLGWGNPIHHLKSPIRDAGSNLFRVARNNVSFAWLNVPLPDMPIHVLGTTWNMLRVGIQRRSLRLVIRGLAHGYGRMWTQRAERRPVRRSTYRLVRRMIRPEPIPLEEVEPFLPPPYFPNPVGPPPESAACHRAGPVPKSERRHRRGDCR